MKQYALSALTLITLLPGISLNAATREQGHEKSLVSVPGVLSGALANTGNTVIVRGWTYLSARGFFAALREYQKNTEYWDTFLNGSAEERTEYCKTYCKEFSSEELFNKVKEALLGDLTSADAKVVKNCALATIIIASLSSAIYYLDKAAQVDDLSSYTDGTDHAQMRLAELARTHENGYFTYYGAAARTCKNEITQLKRELAALDRQESLDNDFRVSTLRKQGMLARWHTQWLFSGAADIINEDGTLNVPVLENLLAQRAVERTQRKEDLGMQLALKRLELQECMKGHLLVQQMPSQYGASIGAGLAGLATLVGSGYALAKVNNWL